MNNYTIYPNVHLGNNVHIDDYVLIGKPPKGKKAGELPTIIGDHAVILSHTVIYAGTMIGEHFQSGHHVTIRENNRIGNNVSIGTGSCIEHQILIEDHVRIHSQAFIPEFSVLKKHCWIGPNVVLTNAKYPQSIHVKQTLKGPTIEEYAIIGANVTILPGKVIGSHSLVGAGSVVVNNVPPGMLVVGNPGKVIRKLTELNCYPKGGK